MAIKTDHIGEYFSDLELFRMFELQDSDSKPVWHETKRKNQASKRIIPANGEPGSKARIEHYAELAAQGLPIC